MTEASSPRSPSGAGVDREQAMQIATRAIHSMDPTTRWVLLGDATQEREFGWVFFYTTAQFAATGDRRFLKPGNGPLVVDRQTGQPQFLTSSMPPDRAVAVYEAQWRAQRGRP